eukprot:GHUV01050878.1.p1 GENE.GHUV01050878.1~~GHUV01050878.1.p1  ORF type:complete len:138 (-),score=28.64 GHUV01050878.1:50-463(-)
MTVLETVETVSNGSSGGYWCCIFTAEGSQVQALLTGCTASNMTCLCFYAGDPVGAAAIAKLHELSHQYPDQMYCPIDHYVSGDEKEMLLQATDFCLLPSRFEPCGLVDVEFGWNGALTIGESSVSWPDAPPYGTWSD